MTIISDIFQKTEGRLLNKIFCRLSTAETSSPNLLHLEIILQTPCFPNSRWASFSAPSSNSVFVYQASPVIAYLH